jgi:hypothetical protein
VASFLTVTYLQQRMGTMPTGIESIYAWSTVGPVRKAWTAHYIAKGCHPMKARECANKKFNTWPPGHKNHKGM